MAKHKPTYSRGPDGRFLPAITVALIRNIHSIVYLTFVNVFTLIVNVNARVKYSRRQLRSIHTYLPTTTPIHATHSPHSPT
jgi:hypothetical protein